MLDKLSDEGLNESYPTGMTDKLREWNIDIDGLQEKGVAVYA